MENKTNPIDGLGTVVSILYVTTFYFYLPVGGFSDAS